MPPDFSKIYHWSHCKQILTTKMQVSLAVFIAIPFWLFLIQRMTYWRAHLSPAPDCSRESPWWMWILLLEGSDTLLVNTL